MYSEKWFNRLAFPIRWQGWLIAVSFLLLNALNLYRISLLNLDGWNSVGIYLFDLSLIAMIVGFIVMMTKVEGLMDSDLIMDFISVSLERAGGKTSSSQFVAACREKFNPLGKIKVVRMFGEYGIYCDKELFAMVCGDELFLKNSSELSKVLPDDGVRPYTGSLNYLHVPQAVLENKEGLLELARKSMSK
jgi:TfoX/Sxy family transcriptional regulator of competence genes